MDKNDYMNSLKKMTRVMENKPMFPIAKGELWLGTDLLKQAGYVDTLENHLFMVDRLGHDMICLPVTDSPASKPMLGYRYFQCSDLKLAVRKSDRFVVAVVDGPFQELVNNLGLMGVMTGWLRNQSEIIKAYEIEKGKVLDLISNCLSLGVHAVTITDDLASDQGPLIRPVDIGMLCNFFYKAAVREINEAGAYSFLHSCGNITGLTDLIKKWGLNGLASIQHGANNLFELKKTMGPGFVFMAGIDAELLVSEPSLDKLAEFRQILKVFKSIGGLILSSSCGLYEGGFLNRIENLYTIAEEI